MRERSEFARVLADYRKARGISQYRLAERVDCVPSTLSRLEMGHRSPSRQFVERLVEALRLPPREANLLRVSAGFAPVYSKGQRAA